MPALLQSLFELSFQELRLDLFLFGAVPEQGFPVGGSPFQKLRGLVKIWRLFELGGRQVVGNDSAEGGVDFQPCPAAGTPDHDARVVWRTHSFSRLAFSVPQADPAALVRECYSPEGPVVKFPSLGYAVLKAGKIGSPKDLRVVERGTFYLFRRAEIQPRDGRRECRCRIAPGLGRYRDRVMYTQTHRMAQLPSINWRQGYDSATATCRAVRL